VCGGVRDSGRVEGIQEQRNAFAPFVQMIGNQTRTMLIGDAPRARSKNCLICIVLSD